MERHASAQVLWSDAALAVRFRCRQAEPLVVHPAPQTGVKTIGLWERDVCEIFLAANPDELWDYYEFEAAPTGEWLDLALRQTAAGRETDWAYDSGMTAAARVETGVVTIAMRIPWSGMGMAEPAAGQKLRTNLFRCVGAGETRGYLAWRPTFTPQPNFHVPEAFGLLVLGQ